MQANMIFHLHSTICYTPNEASSRGKDTLQEVTKLSKTLCKVSLFNDLTGYSLHLLIAPGPALRQTAMLAACQKNAVFLSPRWVCTHRSLFAPVLSSAEIIPRTVGIGKQKVNLTPRSSNCLKPQEKPISVGMCYGNRIPI